MIVYKVVYCDYHNKLFSAMTMGGNWSVAYPRYRWASGPFGTPLLAFDTPERAVDFHRQYCSSGWEIWEAEAENARPQGMLSSYLSRYDTFWKEGASSSEACLAPPGTMACDRIRLTKRLA
jgi:hypothetical protein